MRFFKFQNFLADDHGGKRVQLARRFVVKDQLRFDDQRAGDGGALLHAAGKFGGHLVHGVLEADGFQFFRDDAVDFLRRFQPVFGQIKPDIFADGQRIEQRAGLENQRHAVFGGDFRRFDGFAVDEDFPGVRRFQADEMLEQNAFAAAARPHDDKNFARA